MAWPVSDRFKAAVRQSHRRVSRVDVLVNSEVVGSIGTLPDGTEYGGVIGGQVEIERTTVRRRLSGLVVIDPDALLTRTVTEGGIEWLTPWGNEIRVWRGIDYQDGSEPEMVPLGTFQLWDLDESFPEVAVTAYDRAHVINSFRFTTPFHIERDLPLHLAVRRVIETRWPGVPLVYNFAETPYTTPAIMLEEQDEPWTRASKRLAAAGGMDLHFGPMGDVVMTQEPTEANQFVAVERFFEGTDSVRLPGTSRTRSAAQRYNGVIVTAENTDNVTGTNPPGPIRAEVWDMNPASPTYAEGRFGRRPRWYANPWARTADQCRSSGQAVLRSELGATDGYRLRIVPMGYLDAGDLIEFGAGTGDIITASQMLDKATIPLAGGEMSIDTRGALPIEDIEQ